MKAGAPRPDISTIDAYKAVLLASKSVGFSRGCSGTHTQEGIDKLGIGEQMKAKIKLTGGGPVAEYLAKGDFELGIQQTNVIQPYAGTTYLGPLPADLMEYGRFGAAVMTVSKNREGAQALIKFMADPANHALIRKSGMEPPAK